MPLAVRPAASRFAVAPPPPPIPSPLFVPILSLPSSPNFALHRPANATNMLSLTVEVLQLATLLGRVFGGGYLVARPLCALDQALLTKTLHFGRLSDVCASVPD